MHILVLINQRMNSNTIFISSHVRCIKRFEGIGIWFLCDAIILTSMALIGIAFAEERKTFTIDVICPENDSQDVIRYCATFTVE